MSVEIVWRARTVEPPDVRIGRELVDGVHVADVLHERGRRWRRPRATGRWHRVDLVLRGAA